jgi:hypothetical protein
MKKLALFFFILLQYLITNNIYSQPSLPPRSFTVNATQALNFGTFCLNSLSSSGGSVQVDWQGNRSSTGQIILLNNNTWSPAIYEIKLCSGRNVIITYSPTTTLSGSNGGSLTLNIGPTEKGGYGSSFPVNYDCNFITPIRVGGTLIIGNNSANPAGTYSGNFSITFNQQ